VCGTGFKTEDFETRKYTGSRHIQSNGMDMSQVFKPTFATFRWQLVVQWTRGVVPASASTSYTGTRYRWCTHMAYARWPHATNQPRQALRMCASFTTVYRYSFFICVASRGLPCVTAVSLCSRNGIRKMMRRSIMPCGCTALDRPASTATSRLQAPRSHGSWPNRQRDEMQVLMRLGSDAAMD
jgi:hypothetical protein